MQVIVSSGYFEKKISFKCIYTLFSCHKIICFAIFSQQIVNKIGVGLGYRFKANCPLVGHGPVKSVPSVGGVSF